MNSTLPQTRPVRLRADISVSLAALALVLLWDFSGLDMVVARSLATANGFPWRDAWLTRHLLHDGGRLLASCVLARLVWSAWRAAALPKAHVPGRTERLWALGAVVACLILVPALKRLSDTSCPWSLAEFGGVAAYVPHGSFGRFDGGPGHCFPSGHAAAAFAFFPMVLLWRRWNAARSRVWLLAVLGLGLMFGAAQTARGAHFVSHTLWTAWLCWALSLLIDGLNKRFTPSSID